MKKHKNIIIDIAISAFYAILWVVFSHNKIAVVFNACVTFAVILFNCIYYRKTKKIAIKAFSIVILCINLCNISVQVSEIYVPIYFVLVLNFLLIVWAMGKDKKPSIIAAILSIVLVSVAVLGMVQSVDSSFVQSTEVIEAIVSDKYVFGHRIGFYDYELEADNESEYCSFSVYVDKSFFDNVSVGDVIEIEVCKGLFGYYYYDLKTK